MSGCLERPHLAIRSPGAGVIGCELPDVGAERLWQIKRHSQRQPFSSPFASALKAPLWFPFPLMFLRRDSGSHVCKPSVCVCGGGVKLGAMSTFSVASVKKRSRGNVPAVCTWHADRKDEAESEGPDTEYPLSSPSPVPLKPPSLEEDSSGAADALWLLTSPEMLVCDPASRVCRDRERWEFTGLDLRSGSELPMFWST